MLSVRHRSAEPVLIAAALVVVAIVLAAWAFAGCGAPATTESRGAASSRGSEGVAPVREPGPLTSVPAPEPEASVREAEAARVAERCDWQAPRGIDEVSEAKVRSTFVDRGGGGPRLLLERSAIRPGGILEVAVANDSDETIRYGTLSHLEDAASGAPVEIDGPYGFRAIGLGAPPGTVGPCVPIVVPSDTPPGSYRAALDGVNSGRNDPGTTLEAPVQVSGNPLPSPAWERRLEQAKKKNDRKLPMLP